MRLRWDVIYFVILDYGNVFKKNKLKTLMSHHSNMHHIKGVSQQIKHPLNVYFPPSL